MASGEMKWAAKKDWLPANPWMWLAAGAGFTVWAWLWTLSFGVIASDTRVAVLALGLLLAGVGVWLRWNDPQTVYLRPCSDGLARFARLGMVGLFTLLALGITVLFVLTLFYSNQMVWKPGTTFLVWLSVAPASLLAAFRCLKREKNDPELSAVEEVGFSLAAAAGVCFLGSLALYIPDDPTDWDSIRMLLRILTAICLLGSALVLVSTRMRRLVLSLLIVLHFAGISTACLAAPPSPWIVGQIWIRIFRPYLELMYLNNAYHFYAPEPAPASYMWFRLIYTAPDGQEYGWWYKVPELDDKGRSVHSIGLEYQRYLALTEYITAPDATPAPITTDAKGAMQVTPVILKRLRFDPVHKKEIDRMPMDAEQKKQMESEPANTNILIPLHPLVPQMQQISPPNESSRRMLASYARFVAHKYAVHPENPSWKFKSVKIYRVMHLIPMSSQLVAGVSPTDPELYRPYFMGNYLPDGTLHSDDDPYLNWLLPILRKRNEPGVWDYARLHAGDPLWYRPEGSTSWQESPPERTTPPEGLPK